MPAMLAYLVGGHAVNMCIDSSSGASTAPPIHSCCSSPIWKQKRLFYACAGAPPGPLSKAHAGNRRTGRVEPQDTSFLLRRTPRGWLIMVTAVVIIAVAHQLVIPLVLPGARAPPKHGRTLSNSFPFNPEPPTFRLLKVDLSRSFLLQASAITVYIFPSHLSRSMMQPTHAYLAGFHFLTKRYI